MDGPGAETRQGAGYLGGGEAHHLEANYITLLARAGCIGPR